MGARGWWLTHAWQIYFFGEWVRQRGSSPAAFLWASANTKRVSQNEQNAIHLSPVSCLEISLNFILGKLRIEDSMPEYIPDFVAREGWCSIYFQVSTAACLPAFPKKIILPSIILSK
jgi:PIN domain nuclease of toxin-antitoxin system